MVYQLNLKLIKFTRLLTPSNVKQLVSQNTMNGAEKSSCGFPKSGKLALVATEDGLISKMITKQWTANTWKVSGGPSNKCMKKV